MAKRQKQQAEQAGKPSGDGEAEVPFETALENLEKIVAALEDGTLSLEDSMQRFEEAVRLLRMCYATLERAEQRIETLVSFDDNGQPEFTPFEAEATMDKRP